MMNYLSEYNFSLKKTLIVGTFSLGSIVAAKQIYNFIKDCQHRRYLTQLRIEYQNELKNKMNQFENYLLHHPMAEADIETILSISPCDLILKLRSKELNFAKVLLAYQHKAFAINKSVNCITEFIKPDYSEINLDGPLAGLPVSVKESFCLKGLKACMGCSQGLTLPPAAEDCIPIKVIKDLGGIPFCRTNIPQTMMSFQSSNPVYGVTLNPFDSARTSGGSSSGEGALVGAGGSPLGLGTDIGGSIRVPALFCGCVGFKPTAKRFSRKGMISLNTQTLIPACYGPLAPDVDTCIEIIRLLTNSQLQRNLDCEIVPANFQENMLTERPLRVGYFTFDGLFHASPPLVNVVNEIRDVLIQHNHQLVPFNIPGEPKERLRLYLSLLSSDAAAAYRNFVRYDELDGSLYGALIVVTYGRLWHRMLAKLNKFVFRNEDAALRLICGLEYSTVNSLWSDFSRLEKFRQTFEEEWKLANLDILLCPAFGTIAPFAHNTSSSTAYTGACIYTALFNMLNYPAGVVPVRLITLEDLVNVNQIYDKPSKNSMWHKNVKKFHENSAGLPIGVQIVALPWKDELCLRGMKIVESAIEMSRSSSS